MKKKLPYLKAIFCLVSGLLFLPQKSIATHVAGAELTYLIVAPNIYVVTGKIYRHCSGGQLNTAEVLNIKSPGCNTGRSISMPLIPGNPTVPTDRYYCPSVLAQAVCNSNATLPNIEIGTYRATITFSAAEQNCQNWYLSMSLPTRPNVDNLAFAQSYNVYAEAYLKLNTQLINNSPEFHGVFNAIPFVCVNQENSIAINTVEPDGDSLSYELVRPFHDYNVPIPYAANTNTGSPQLPAGT